MIQKPTTGAVRCHMYRGRYPDPELAGTVDMIPVHPEEPHERTADGCPGGWYRTAWCNSVARYTRRRTQTGARVPNPFFESASWQVQEAVLYLEHEQERHAAHRAEVSHQRWQAKHRPKNKGGR